MLRTIPPILFPASEFKEADHRLALAIEEFALLATRSTDPSPTSHDSHFAKQRGLYGERIIARHVFRLVDTLAIKPEDEMGHAPRMGYASSLRLTRVLNRSQLFDSRC